MNKKIKKNQHLVSQFIQKQFSNENKKIYGIKEIELINDGSIKYEINKFSITNTMCKKDSYELPNISLNYLENEFSKIESKYVSIYNELVLLIEKKDSYKKIKEYITNKCMPYFLWFYYRTYQFTLLGLEEENTNLQQKQKLLRFKDTLFDSKYLYELSKTILNCYNMYILESTSEDFLLSDCYLCTASTNFKGYYSSDYRIWSNRLIGLKNMLILIPINAKYYILFTDDPSFFIENNFKKNHYIKIYKNNIWRYNSIIYRNCW